MTVTLQCYFRRMLQLYSINECPGIDECKKSAQKNLHDNRCSLAPHPEILSSDLRGMSAEQITLPWIMMEGKGCLCYSNKDVKYSHNVGLIDNYLDYLYTI